jgi:hypothetical protein
MPRCNESIRPMILGDMRADGVRSLNCQVICFDHRHFRRELASRHQGTLAKIRHAGGFWSEKLPPARRICPST